MSNKVGRVKGMYDLLPEQLHRWRQIERACTQVLDAYGYEEIRLPLLEKTELFSTAIGTTTDVVSKEMYSFEDRGGDLLSLRPEGTAGCVRAAIGNGLLQAHGRKLWYHGPMFRRENVQRGRNRQFYQIGAEAYGLPGPDVDAELIVLLARIWRQLGITGLRLEINSLGTAESRAGYRDALVSYFNDHKNELDEDSLRRLDVNPMRILDSKNPELAGVIAAAPIMLDHLDQESEAHFQRLRALLDDCAVPYQVNPRLVRGLDYYSRTVFEWITNDLGSQGTVCGGGRYDYLVERQGGAPTPGVGFSIGVDRCVDLMEVQQGTLDLEPPHVYLVVRGEEPERRALGLSEVWRDRVPGLRLLINQGGGSFKAQFKRADRSGARVALVIGEEELARGEIAWKPLRDDDGEQRTVSLEGLPDQLQAMVAGRA